jgi:hypothetical protein
MLVDNGEEEFFTSYAELDKLDRDSMVYNNMVMTVGEWKHSWKVPVSSLVNN